MSSSNTCGIFSCTRSETNFVTRCGHHFHKFCLKRWFERGTKLCPECTGNISLSETVERHKREGSSLTDHEKRHILFNSDYMDRDNPKLMNSLAVYLESMDLWDKSLMLANKDHKMNLVIGLFLLENAGNSEIMDSDSILPILRALTLRREDPLDTLIDLLWKWNKLSLDRFFVVACTYGYINIISILLDLGASANNIPALTSACGAGQFDIVKLLIKNGANVNCHNDQEYVHRNIKKVEVDNMTPLMIASEKGNIGLISFLLDSGANINLEIDGKTALFYACRAGQLDAFNFLISLDGACFHSYGAKAKLLETACKYEHLDLFNKLLELGCSTCTGKLWFVHKYGSIKMVEKLLKSGTDVNQKSEYEGNSLLHLACCHRIVELVEIFLSLGADINCTNRKSLTPIFLLCDNVSKGELDRFSAILNALIDAGLDINSRNSNGETALSWAIRCNSTDKIIDILVEKGADVNVVLDNGDTLLHVACEKWNPIALKKLIELNCIHVNSKNTANLTPLHYLCKYQDQVDHPCSLESVDILIEKGAEIGSVDDSHRIITDLCFNHGYKEFAKILMNLGAKI